MVKFFMGLKGSGKTKHLIEMVNEAVASSNGAIVCIEHGAKLTYDISSGARLIDTVPYDIRSYQVLRGFITGLYAGNYDINHIFIDSLFKITKNADMDECEKFLGWCEKFGGEHQIDFTITASESVDKATEGVKKYFPE